MTRLMDPLRETVGQWRVARALMVLAALVAGACSDPVAPGPDRPRTPAAETFVRVTVSVGNLVREARWVSVEVSGGGMSPVGATTTVAAVPPTWPVPVPQLVLDVPSGTRTFEVRAFDADMAEVQARTVDVTLGTNASAGVLLYMP